MKQLFSFRMVEDKRVYEGEEFITRRLDKELAEKLDGMEARYDALDAQIDEENAAKKAQKTPLQRFVHYGAFLCAGLILLFTIFITSHYGSLENAFNASLLWSLPVFLLALGAAILLKVDKRINKEEDPLDHPALDRLMDEEDALLDKAYEALGITEDDDSIEVLTPSADGYSDLVTNCDTIFLTVKREDDHLILSDQRVRYEFPISSFLSLEHSQSSIALNDWNNYPNYNRGEFRAYQIKKQNDKYILPWYDIVTLDTVHGKYTLLLPPYAGETLAKMLGLDYGE